MFAIECKCGFEVITFKVEPTNYFMSAVNLLRTRFKQVFSFRILRNCLLFAIAPAFVFFVASLFVLTSVGFSTEDVVRDAAQTLNASSFLGFLSTIGIWVWVSAAAICFFSAMSNDFSGQMQRRGMLLLMGLFSLALAVDDFFLLHERYINQNYCFLVYAALAGALLVKYWELLFKFEGLIFLIAGFFLAFSIAIDLIQPRYKQFYNILQLAEEGSKFLGAATWLYFNCRLATVKVNSTSITSQKQSIGKSRNVFLNDNEIVQ